MKGACCTKVIMRLASKGGEGWNRKSMVKVMEKTSLEPLVSHYYPGKDQREKALLSLRVYLSA